MTPVEAGEEILTLNERINKIFGFPDFEGEPDYDIRSEMNFIYEAIRDRRIAYGTHIATDFDGCTWTRLLSRFDGIGRSAESSPDPLSFNYVARSDSTSDRTINTESATRTDVASARASSGRQPSIGKSTEYSPFFIDEGFQTGHRVEPQSEGKMQKPQAVADANTKKSTKTRKRGAAAALEKQKVKKVKNEAKPVVDVAVVKVYPTISAMKLFAILLHHAIPSPSTASPSILVATKARPDVMRPMIQQMVFCLLSVHSPQAQNRQRLSITVPKKDAYTLDVPPSVLKAKYESKVEWVARQIQDSRNQTGRLNVLESYYHDFIKAEAQTQDAAKITKALSRHAVAKDFAQQIGIKGTSDTNITKYEYLWSMLSNIRSLGVQSLIQYRDAAMNALLKDETLRPTNTRLRVSEVEEWGALIENIAQHLKACCIVDVDTTWPTHRWKYLAEKIIFQTNCGEPLAKAPPKRVQVDTYGFKGYSDLNRSWALMTPSVGPARPLAITCIEENSYLGIMPGKIRFGGVCSPSAIVGPDGLWLDLEGEEGCLAKIPETTSIDQVNINVAWEYTEDELILGSTSARILVFASRKIEIFQDVWRMRW